MSYQLGNSDIVELTEWRRELHRFPEISGEEAQTARRVEDRLRSLGPDHILTGLGGHGVAAVFDGAAEGPGLMIRCELDALPIPEISTFEHRSRVPGKGHLCGHDGHMSMVMAVARVLSRQRPERGRVVLMFQPAEENGSGAAAVISDPRFDEIRTDYALSLHNMPGLPLGSVSLRPGPVNCASRGMRIGLNGRTAHASDPATGVSPMAALARLMPELTALGRGNGPEDAGFTLATVTHARLGEPTFGVAPGEAELWVTLRTMLDADMADLVESAEALVAECAVDAGLEYRIDYHDVFRHCENDPEAVELLTRAMADEGLSPVEAGQPMRASEDFGRFVDHAKAAMFLLGAGESCPNLHNPDYDFPDELIPIGARIFLRAVDQLLNET